MNAVTEEDLRRALSEDQFVLHHQPQFAVDGTTMIGVEALVRLTCPEGGLIPPMRFIPIAESTGLIKELGVWCLRQACTDGLSWPGLTVAVNVSPIQFQDVRFIDAVDRVIKETGFPPRRLEIEMTETAYFEDIDHADSLVKMLKARGIRVALDDFGTGYASLTYLHRLALDKIKIDRSFVAKVDRIDCAAIVQAVTAVARTLGLKVVAEGVETHEQHRFLKSAGCHILQGFLFSVPVTAEAIGEMVARRPAGQPDLRPSAVPQG